MPEPEYFPDDAQLNDTILPAGLKPYEAREAARTLKGSTLRQEVYALDGTSKAQIPYTVAESNFTIHTLQPLATNRYAVFFTHPRETITFHYERHPDDPRIGQTLTLAVDDYGNVLTSASIGYGRRKPALEEQGQVLATLSENQYTNAVLQPDAYRTPIPSQVSTYELTAPELRGAQPLEFDAVEFLAASANEIPYDAKATGGQIEKRPIERQRSLYRKNDLEGLLPLDRVESMALPGESYKLALTSGLLDIFRSKATPDEMRSILSDARYRDLDEDGLFWVPSGQAFYSPDSDDPAARELGYARAHFFLPHRFRDPFGNTTIVAYDEKYNLSLVYTRDAAGNETTSEPDYRVLQPSKVTDPNGNRAEARFDALGMLAGTALLGKAIGPVEGDSFDQFVTDLTPSQMKEFFDADDPYALASEHLGTASTRILYDLTRVPICAASIARETHVSDLAPGERSRVQLHFVYSDGFGREAQSKIQAEAGPLDPDDAGSPVANPRWVGSGAKIYNNKGKPVREYEPFFSPTPHFGIEKWGVSNTLFYDPVLRVVATLHPNNTYEKVVFDPWKQITFDVNDTVTLDPKTDPDVGEYLSRLPDSDYLPTWYQQRIDGAEGPHERTAAIKASKDAGTPTVAHFDTLGRTVLSVADNGDGQYFRIRSVLDIEGNQRAVIDPLDRVVMRYDYDMLSTRIHQASMEAGERWMLNDAVGKPVRAWNSRGFAFRTEYDHLRRPVKSFVKGEALPHEILFERTIYGESPETELSEAQRKQANLRGKAFRHFDGAGVVVTDLNDFKGNPLRSARRFAREYKQALDWSQPQALESRTFSSTTKYDALNRAIAVTTPDKSVYRPRFNDANLLEAVDVNLRGAEQKGQPVWTPFITYINYDAKGQRTICRYGNSLETTYEYDEKTFRLIHLKTTRTTIESGLTAKIFRHFNTIQDLRYTYDPVGNITRIEDGALKTVIHANQQLDAACEYTYDPIYRLIEATGREHIGQSAFNFVPEHGDDRDYPFEGAAQLTDLQALQHYTEGYEYDPAGNFLKMFHRAAHRNWTREYRYCESSLLEPRRNSNRLSETALDTRPGAPVERYSYDAHGNMTRMPHLPSMKWNYKDQLSATSGQVVKAGEPETTYYVYDANGQRARKVTENQKGAGSSERFYVGGFEVFREFSGCEVAMERETLHIMDDKQRIALVETKTIEDGDAIHGPTLERRYQLANHLGSASVEVDEAGGLITYEEYSPYGDTTFQAGTSAAEVRRKRYRYTSKERDRENGFYYHHARYYAPWLAMWTSCDPVKGDVSLSLYNYVRNNPLRLVDTKGESPEDADPKKRTGSQLLNTALSGAHAIAEGSIWNPTVWGRISDNARRAIDFRRGVILEKFAGNITAEGLGRITGGLGRFAKDADRATSTVVQQIKSTSNFRKVAQITRDATRDAARFIANDANYAGRAAQARILLPTGTPATVIDSAENALSSLRKPIAGIVADAKVTTGIPGIGGLALKALAPIGAGLSAYSLGEDIAKKDYAASLGDASGAVAGGLETFALASTALGAGGTGAAATGGLALAGTAGGGGAAAAASVAAPVVAAFGVGVAIGTGLEKTLNVSDYSSAHGIQAQQFAKSLGAGETTALVAGGIVTVAATPLAIEEAAVSKGIDLAKRAWNWAHN